MTEQNQSENLRYEQDPKGPIGQFFAPFAGYGVTLSSFFRFFATGCSNCIHKKNNWSMKFLCLFYKT